MSGLASRYAQSRRIASTDAAMRGGWLVKLMPEQAGRRQLADQRLPVAR
jgi:hypothetical protein